MYRRDEEAAAASESRRMEREGVGEPNRTKVRDDDDAADRGATFSLTFLSFSFLESERGLVLSGAYLHVSCASLGHPSNPSLFFFFFSLQNAR